jgi:hypothetical protein
MLDPVEARAHQKHDVGVLQGQGARRLHRHVSSRGAGWEFRRPRMRG